MTAPRSVPVHEKCELTKGQVFGETGFIQIGIAIGIGIDWNAERSSRNWEGRASARPGGVSRRRFVNAERRTSNAERRSEKLLNPSTAQPRYARIWDLGFRI